MQLNEGTLITVLAAEWGTSTMRIQWTETYLDQQIHFIADEMPNGFCFAEREGWENCWLDVPATPDLLRKASYFLEAAQDPDYDGPYVFRRKAGDDSVIRVFLKPGSDVDQGRLPKPARDRFQPVPAQKNPWVLDSFYLFAAGVMVLLGVLVAKVVDQVAAVLFILALAPLQIILLTTFHLLDCGRLSQGRFQTIMQDALRFLRIPAVPKELTKRAQKLTTSLSRKK